MPIERSSVCFDVTIRKVTEFEELPLEINVTILTSERPLPLVSLVFDTSKSNHTYRMTSWG